MATPDILRRSANRSTTQDHPAIAHAVTFAHIGIAVAMNAEDAAPIGRRNGTDGEYSMPQNQHTDETTIAYRHGANLRGEKSFGLTAWAPPHVSLPNAARWARP